MILIDILFPKTCFGCGHLGTYFCQSCVKHLIKIKNDTCPYCNKASPLGLTHPVCRRKNGLDGAVSLFYYSGLFKRIIKKIKYRLVREAQKEFFDQIGLLIIDKMIKYKKIDQNFYVQPIPLSKKRLHQRGFNQAEPLANFLTKFLNFRPGDFLIRKKETAIQAQLKNSRDRYFNLKGAFSLNSTSSPKNKKIILVDDIITTGTTVKEAARVLKIGLAEKVIAFSLAKG
ncbi:MAG: phosphoribosyltransferase family protein [Microgenomates group bacterium]|nr:phosphoribosyltransferase family protein [Microgenomates group bacterium]